MCQNNQLNPNSILGSYIFQGGETGIFSLLPYGEGDSLAEIEFLPPANAVKHDFGNNEIGWILEDGNQINLSKIMMTRRLGNKIEPFFKHPSQPGVTVAIEYRLLDGTMELEDDWSFLDVF